MNSKDFVTPMQEESLNATVRSVNHYLTRQKQLTDQVSGPKLASMQNEGVVSV